MTQNEAQNASEREPLPDTVFADQLVSILGPFGVHFGTHFAPEAIKIAPKSPLEKSIEFSLIFEEIPRKPGRGGRGGPGIVPHLVKAMVFDEIGVLASTGSQILKILILRATLPREKSL